MRRTEIGARAHCLVLTLGGEPGRSRPLRLFAEASTRDELSRWMRAVHHAIGRVDSAASGGSSARDRYGAVGGAEGSRRRRGAPRSGSRHL